MKLHQIYLRGIAVGAIDVVPGISGGTMAFILGVYERLIQALSRFDLGLWPIWKQQGFRGLWQAVDGSFLLTLVAGIATGLFLMINAVDWLLTYYPLPFKGFIFGLVLGSGIIISREIKGWTLRTVGFLFMGGVISWMLGLLLPLIGGIGPLTFFVAGMIAICAMLLPGISGSFMLLIMGLYGPVIHSVKTLDWPLLIPFALGAGLGLIAFSHLLVWLFRHYHSATFATLFGLVISSLPNIWPWQQVIRYRINESGKMFPLDSQFLQPWQYTEITGEPSLWISVTTATLIGWVLVILLAPGNK